jgi:acyl carrier protein
MTQEHERKLAEVFRAVFNLGPDADVTTVRQLTTPGWDSIAHVSLMSAVESEFGVVVDTGEFMEMTSYAAIRQYLEEQVK